MNNNEVNQNYPSQINNYNDAQLQMANNRNQEPILVDTINLDQQQQPQPLPTHQIRNQNLPPVKPAQKNKNQQQVYPINQQPQNQPQMAIPGIPLQQIPQQKHTINNHSFLSIPGLNKLVNVKNVKIYQTKKSGLSDIVCLCQQGIEFKVFAEDDQYSNYLIFSLEFEKPSCGQDVMNGKFYSWNYDQNKQNPKKEIMFEVNHDRNNCALKGFLSSWGLCGIFNYYIAQTICPPQSELQKEGKSIFSLEYRDMGSKIIILDEQKLAKFIVKKESYFGSQTYIQSGNGLPLQGSQIQSMYKNLNNFEKEYTKVQFADFMTPQDRAAIIFAVCKMVL